MAVETALLTEVNLPWYTAGVAHGLASCPDPIQEFVRVWTWRRISTQPCSRATSC